MSVTYSSYLKLDELLAAQEPRSTAPEHDEMLFIIIHQVYELWFKQVLHETDYLIQMLKKNDRMRGLHTLRRILTILKTLVAQIDVLETMTPLEFLSFRDRLDTASGFQSFQFRELEFLLGYKREAVMVHHADDPQATQKLRTRLEQPSLWDTFLRFIQGYGYEIPPHLLHGVEPGPIQPSPEVQEVLKAIYRSEPRLIRICERLVDLDEGIQEWRYRHIKMVERTIGAQKGTGGSAGVQYLQTTLKPLFPDLWLIRTEI